jgi:hypothetical protein
MKKLLLLLIAFFVLTVSARATDIDIGASSIVGFNTANAGNDTSLSGVSVTLSSPSVTCSNCLPIGAVGLSGMKVALGTPAVVYDIASVASRSAFTLTTNYAASTGTVTGTLYKFVHLRIYVTSPFVPSGSTTVVQSGAQGTTAWYRRYAVSIVNDGAQNVAFVPAVNDLPATTDSSDQTATYVAGLWTQGGGFMQSYPGCVDEFRLSHLTTPTSWAQICTFNSTPPTPPSPPASFYNTFQIDSRFPSCSVGQMLYYAVTGNVQSCLALSAEFSISGGTLSLAAPATGYNRIQEEGGNLPQRTTSNFIGSSFTAADDAGNSRTNITADSDLNALASTATTGYYVVTGTGTSATRTFNGTANEITVANGSGVPGNTTLSLPAALTFTGKTVTGGIYAGISALGIRSSGAAFDLQIASTEVLTANRTLTVTLGDANRTLSLAGNLTTSGANPLTFTTAGSTNVTLPLTGTVATTGNTETLSNKTLPTPRIGTSLNDTNGNEVIRTPATGSAVNDVTVTNSTTGNAPSIASSGDDAVVGLTVATKSTGNFTIQTNSVSRATIHGTNAEAYFGNGITNAAPATYSINGTGGSGTNTAGANLDLAGGKGTGNAVPGQLAARYPLRTASGTTLQNLSTQRFPISVGMYTNTSNGTSISNTTTETSLFTGAAASSGSTLTIEGGIAAAGTMYRLRMDVPFSTTGTPTARIRIKLGSSTIADTTAFTTATVANGRMFIAADIFIDSVGASGSVRTEITGYMMPVATGTGTPLFFVGSVGAVTVDFTVSQTIDATYQWGTASPSNNATLQRASVERVR